MTSSVLSTVDALAPLRELHFTGNGGAGVFRKFESRLQAVASTRGYQTLVTEVYDQHALELRRKMVGVSSPLQGSLGGPAVSTVVSSGIADNTGVTTPAASSSASALSFKVDALKIELVKSAGDLELLKVRLQVFAEERAALVAKLPDLVKAKDKAEKACAGKEVVATSAEQKLFLVNKAYDEHRGALAVLDGQIVDETMRLDQLRAVSDGLKQDLLRLTTPSTTVASAAGSTVSPSQQLYNDLVCVLDGAALSLVQRHRNDGGAAFKLLLSTYDVVDRSTVDSFVARLLNLEWSPSDFEGFDSAFAKFATAYRTSVDEIRRISTEHAWVEEVGLLRAIIKDRIVFGGRPGPFVGVSVELDKQTTPEGLLGAMRAREAGGAAAFRAGQSSRGDDHGARAMAATTFAPRGGHANRGASRGARGGTRPDQGKSDAPARGINRRFRARGRKTEANAASLEGDEYCQDDDEQGLCLEFVTPDEVESLLGEHSVIVNRVSEDALAAQLIPSTAETVVTKTIVDTGATRTVLRNASDLHDMVAIPAGRMKVCLGDETCLDVLGKGTFSVDVLDDQGRRVTMTFSDVLYVPDMRFNLLSVSQVNSERFGLVLPPQEDGPAYIYKGAIASPALKVPLTRRQRLFHLDVLPQASRVTLAAAETVVIPPVSVASPVVTATPPVPLVSTVTPLSSAAELRKANVQLLHERHAHMGLDRLALVYPDVDVRAHSKDEMFCDACALGKSTRAAVSSTRRDDMGERKPGDKIATDSKGPLPPSLSGCVHVVAFMDTKSRYARTFPIKSVSDIPDKLDEFVASMRSPPIGEARLVLGSHTTIKSDMGTTYMGKKFQSKCELYGFSRQATSSYTQAHNGELERLWRTLFEMARACLFAAHLPPSFWAEALNYATYVYNRSPHSALAFKSPFEAVSGIKPDCSAFRCFGSVAFVHDTEAKALADKATIGVFVGVDPINNCPRIFVPATGRVRSTRNVRINEAPDARVHRAKLDGTPFVDPFKGLLLIANQQALLPGPVSAEPVPSSTDPVVVPVSIGLEHVVLAEAMLAATSFTGSEDARVPRNFQDITNLPAEQQAMWYEAHAKEVDNLTSNGTFVEVPYDQVPPTARVHRAHTLFEWKRGDDGNRTVPKVRTVFDGSTQVHGVDFDKAYAPVARLATLRMFLSLAAANSWVVHQMDVTAAFLHGSLTEEVYVRPPPGFPQERDGRRVVWLLKKSLYGLRQAPRCWNDMLHAWFTAQGFQRSDLDPCLYIGAVRGSDTSQAILVWVDDMLIAGPNAKAVERFKALIGAAFKMTDLGVVEWYLGMHVTRDSGGLRISQAKYVDAIVERAGMSRLSPVGVPMEARRALGPDELVKPGVDFEGLPPFSVNEYRTIVGMVMYLAVCTRPDIAFTASMLARFLAKPTPGHWLVAVGLVRYLRGTRDFSLRYRAVSGLPSNVLMAYSDASFKPYEWCSFSVTGYVLTLNGGPVAWRSGLQTITAPSSTAAEYVALYETVCEVIPDRSVLESLGFPQPPTVIFEDNQPCIVAVTNPGVMKSARMLDVKFHFARECSEKGVIKVVFVPSDANVADLLTKALPKPKLMEFCSLLGLSV